MANQNFKFGLKPLRHFFGGLVRANERSIADQLAANIFRGDLVKSTGTGRNVTVCAAGDRAVGVFQACQYVNAAGDVIFAPYWPTGTDAQGAIKALVLDDPSIEFEVQVSGTPGLVETDVGNVADITAATAGSTQTGMSGMELDQATLAATGSAQLKINGLVDRPDNAYGQYAKAAVLINEHELRAAMTAT